MGSGDDDSIRGWSCVRYGTVATQDQPDLQHDFRLRALWAQTALIPLAIVVFITEKYGAPSMYQGQLVGAAPTRMDRPERDHRNPGALVSQILSGPNRCSGGSDLYSSRLGLAQFPHLVTPDVTIQNAAAPESTLKFLLLALGAGAVVLLPSLFYLFQIFKGQEQR